MLTRLRGKIAKLAWKKTKKRLVITLDKQETTLGWDKEWKELISDKTDKKWTDPNHVDADDEPEESEEAD